MLRFKQFLLESIPKKRLTLSQIRAQEKALGIDLDDPIQAVKLTGKAVGKAATTILDPVSAATSAATKQATKVAPKFSVKPISTSSLASGAAYLGAGTVGGIIGSKIVEPAAEKLGVFDAVESGTRTALSNSPDWVAKVADPILGAAQFALDPVGSYYEFLAKQARMSPPRTQKQKDEALERYSRKNY